MEELEENQSLKKCIEEVKEQMRVVKEMYTNEDFEDRKRIIRMEEEIKELKEEKKIMKIEMEEMRMGRDRRNWTNKGEQKNMEKTG